MARNENDQHAEASLGTGRPWELIGVSKRHWYRMRERQLVPAPVRLGGRRIYLRDEIKDWLKAGAPPRDTWEGIRRRFGWE